MATFTTPEKSTPAVSAVTPPHGATAENPATLRRFDAEVLLGFIVSLHDPESPAAEELPGPRNRGCTVLDPLVDQEVV